MDEVASWRTSSFSGGENNECVEIANTLAAVRDSKNPQGEIVRADLRQLFAAVSADAFVR